MPKYLIHVGPHKTATTYLQLSFDRARKRLHRQRVTYPTEWSSAESEPSHRKLVVGLREKRAVQLRSQFDLVEQNNPEYVLISAEGINNLERSSLELLKALLGRNPVTIIFYCRRWSELLPSLWQEKIKHGYDETFPEFFSINFSDPFESLIMNFAKRLKVYIDIFERENVKLVSYNNLCDDNIDLAGHFFDIFLPRHRPLIDDLPELAAARPNQSLPPLDVEVIRALNSFNIRGGMPPPSSALRGWYMANARRFDLAELFSAIEQNKEALRFSDASPGAQRLQEMLSTAYVDLMVPPARSHHLFAPRLAEIVFFKQRYLTDRRCRHTLDEVYSTFCEELESAARRQVGPAAAPSTVSR